MDRYSYMLDEIKALKELTFKDKVLIPYFRELGYDFVRDFHGPNELGKDIVMSKNNVFGKKINYAVVIKAKKINGRASGDISEISTQVNQAFGSSYLDPKSKKELKINKVIIANNYPIPDGSFRALHAALNHCIDKVEFLDGNEIVTNIEKFNLQIGQLPVIRNSVNDLINKYKLNGLSYKQNKNIKEITVVPSTETPKEILDGNFTLTDTGNKKMEVFYKTGQEVTIHPDEIKKISIPKIWSEIDYIDPDSTNYRMKIGPIGNTARKLTLNIIQNNKIIDKIKVSVSNSGTDSLTLVNNDSILLFNLIINLNDMKLSKFNFKFKEYDKIKAYQLLTYESLIYNICTSDKVEIIDDETGLILTTFKHGEKKSHFVYKERIELLNKIYEIQKFFKVIFEIPNRSFTNDEVDLINKIHQIITKGQYILPGGTINFCIEVNDVNRNLLKTGDFDNLFSLQTQNSDKFLIFDQDISLGESNLFIHKGSMECNKKRIKKKEYFDVTLKFNKDSMAQAIYTDIQKKITS